MAVLAVLVAWTIRSVLQKARSEDVPEVLAGLSQVLGALSCFLPWGKWRNVPREAPASPGTGESGTGVPASASPTITITAGQLAVAPILPEQRTVAAEFPAAEGGRGR
ncbi:hypothetical protein AB0L80_42780 [Streptomyces sp. NPDC052069]|uniref:hypothetical protein n=1 Tax=unclassified Streptomyces TaxID=2593676 RepID=UPI003426EA37